MKLVTFRMPTGAPRIGVLVNEGPRATIAVLDHAHTAGAPRTMREFLGRGDEALREAAREVANPSSTVSLSDVRLLPPVPDPSKFIAVSDNYQSHVAEVSAGVAPESRGIPKFFLKPASTLLAPGDALRLPELSDQVDWEIELAVVIGTGGKDIPVSEALAHVAGYSITVDVSARRINWNAERASSGWDEFFDWLNGKWFDGFGPTGPWLVTRDEIPDPQDLDLHLSVNGKMYQQASTREMSFGVAELVAGASRIMTLEPGDLIATGTPAGVGLATGTFLQPGDRIDASISGLGNLVIHVHDPRAHSEGHHLVTGEARGRS